jgi:hypothetical protein
VPATTPQSLTRRRLAAVAAVAAVPLLSACATFSPATTAVPYNASDGTSVQLGQLEAVNLLVVGSEKGGQGVLSGALVNKGTDDLTVAISAQGAPIPVTITVPGSRMVSLTADSASQVSGGGLAPSTSATVLVPSLPVAPGANLTVQLATRPGGQTQVIVPVLLPLNEYATITAPPTPTATQSPTESPSESPTASPTESPSSSESAQPTTSPS